MALTTPGATALSAGIGAIGEMANTAISNAWAIRQSELDRQQNYMYGERAANNAQERQIALMEEYMTPEAQIKHLKEAGLSPSIMYGAGGGTQGVTAPQGNGASGIQTNIKPFDLTAVTQLASLAQMNAQTDKTKAETENIREQTKTTRGDNKRGEAEIALLLEEKGLKKASAVLTQAQADYQDCLNLIQTQTMDADIQRIFEEAQQAKNRTIFTLYEAMEKKLEFDFNNETFQDRKKLVHTELLNATKDLLLKKAQIELTEKQIYALGVQINQRYDELEIMRNSQEIDVEKFNKQLHQQMEIFLKENVREWENLKASTKLQIFHTLTSLFCAAIGASVLGGVKK